MKTAIALGTFDGLHMGHRAVLSQTSDFFSVAVTFDIPPKSVLTGEPQLLILPDDRERRLKKLGIKQVCMQSFEKVRKINAWDYLEILKRNYNPARVVCGFNYRFGYNAEGNTELLAGFCKENGIEFVCVPPIEKGGKVISSTHIRELMREGNIEEAVSQIYGGFGFTAPVLHGDARGRTLGFPTANQYYPEKLVKLKFGVYISRVTLDGKEYKSITNVGVRPTYRTDKVGCETFIKDFCGDIYGKEMKTELLHFVRGEQKFESIDALKNAIINDVKLLD
ncbi:MAG: riboflavin biosynthesis protein RibF [Clostridia bacterium]|nr:riboflavin biosynthesis protein RibF [Clostridia bacterium]